MSVGVILHGDALKLILKEKEIYLKQKKQRSKGDIINRILSDIYRSRKTISFE